MSHSDLVAVDTFATSLISDQREESLELNAVCILRPTTENVKLLTKELQSPKYKEYHLGITSIAHSLPFLL